LQARLEQLEVAQQQSNRQSTIGPSNGPYYKTTQPFTRLSNRFHSNRGGFNQTNLTSTNLPVPFPSQETPKFNNQQRTYGDITQVSTLLGQQHTKSIPRRVSSQPVQCFACGQLGHICRMCPANPYNHYQPIYSVQTATTQHTEQNQPQSNAFVSTAPVPQVNNIQSSSSNLTHNYIEGHCKSQFTNYST